MTLDDVQSLLDAPSPAVLTTYRRDGSALTTPVWFRFHEGAFEVVLADQAVGLEVPSNVPGLGLFRLLREISSVGAVLATREEYAHLQRETAKYPTKRACLGFCGSVKSSSD